MTTPPQPGQGDQYTLSNLMPSPTSPAAGPAHAYAGPPPTSHQQPRRKTRVILVAAAVALVAVLGFGAAAVAMGGGDPIPDAQTKCDEDGDATRVSDGGQTVAVEARESWEVQTVRCVLRELGAPDAVMEKMNTTRALDGTQEAEWGDYSASWTYHPDAGLNLVITTTG